MASVRRSMMRDSWFPLNLWITDVPMRMSSSHLAAKMPQGRPFEKSRFPCKWAKTHLPVLLRVRHALTHAPDVSAKTSAVAQGRRNAWKSQEPRQGRTCELPSGLRPSDNSHRRCAPIVRSGFALARSPRHPVGSSGPAATALTRRVAGPQDYKPQDHSVGRFIGGTQIRSFPESSRGDLSPVGEIVKSR